MKLNATCYAAISTPFILALSVLFAFYELPARAVIHCIFAAAVLPLIFSAMLHFVPVLTRTRGSHKGWIIVVVGLQLAGLGVTGILAGFLPWYGLAMIALYVLTALLALLIWTWTQMKKMLGRPHPCLYWYLAAQSAACLAFLSIFLMQFELFATLRLKFLHAHLNTLGWIGLSIMGTWPVLLATVLNVPLQNMLMKGLKKGLFLGVLTLILLVCTSFVEKMLWSKAISFVCIAIMLVGVTVWIIGGFAMLQNVLSQRKVFGFSLILSMLIFEVFLIYSAAHVFGNFPAIDLAIMLVFLALPPLMMIALSFLLPVWFFPGSQLAARVQMESALNKFALIRVFLYVIGVVLQFQETSRILGLSLMLLVIFYFSLQMLTGLLRALKWKPLA